MNIFKYLRIYILIILGFLGLTVEAAVCQAEHDAEMRSWAANGASSITLEKNIENLVGSFTRGALIYAPANITDEERRLGFDKSASYLERLAGTIEKANSGYNMDAHHRMLLCVTREQAKSLRAGNGGILNGGNLNQRPTPPTPSPSRQPSRADTTPPDDADQIKTTINRQRSQVENAQATNDRQNEGKRKTHDPAAEASHCVSVDTNPKLYGGFINSCNFAVDYVFCNYKPKKDSWGASFDCEKKHGIGGWAIGPNQRSASHTHNAEINYWFACKKPAGAEGVTFVSGRGLMGRCK